MDVSENGVLTLGETDILKIQVESKCLDKSIYIIPRVGDILLSVCINGEFSQAKLYQYSWNGHEKVVYGTLESEGEMYPFPDAGFPLLQMGKNIYLDVYDAQNIHVEATYALLKKEDRQKLAKTKDGVKVVHRDGDIYQVVNINDYGFSPNTLVKLNTT